MRVRGAGSAGTAAGAGRRTTVVLVAGPVLVGLVFTPFTVDVFMLPKLWLATATTAFGLAWWWQDGRSRPRARPRATAPVVALVAVTALATLVSVNPLVSAVGLTQRFGGLLSLLVYVAAAALVVLVVGPDPRRATAVALAFAATGTAVAAYAIAQRAGVDVFDVREASGAIATYPGSTVGNSNFAGAFLAMSAPFALVVARLDRAWGRRAALAMTGFVVVGLWATQSRGGMVAALVGAAVVALAERRRLPRPVRLVPFVLAAVALAATALAFVAVAGGGDAVPFADDREVLRTDSARQRSFEWQAAVDAFAARPLLGNGPDSFAVTYTRHRTREDGATLGASLSDKPHNVPLERAHDTGLVGFAVYVWLLAAVVAAAVARIRRGDAPIDGPAGEPGTRTVVVAALASLAAYVTQSLFSIDVPPLAYSGWIVIGLLVALCDPAVTPKPAPAPRGRGTRPRPTPGRRRVPPTRRSVLPVIAAVTVTAAVGVPLAADTTLHLAENADRSDDVASAADRYDTAVRLRPLDATYRRAAGFLAERRGMATTERAAQKQHLAAAARRYAEALDRHPGYVPYLVDLARVETLRGQHVDTTAFPRADRWFAEAVARDPHDWELRGLRAASLTAWANAAGNDVALRRRAEAEYEVAVALRPDSFADWVSLGRTRLALGDAAGARAAAAEAARIVPFSTPVWEIETGAERLEAGTG